MTDIALEHLPLEEFQRLWYCQAGMTSAYAIIIDKIERYATGTLLANKNDANDVLKNLLVRIKEEGERQSKKLSEFIAEDKKRRKKAEMK